MKNSTLFILLAGTLILFSCGTTNRTSYATSEFRNGIYYTPDQQDEQTYVQSKTELNKLQSATAQSLNNTSKGNSYNSQTNVETIFVGDTNAINIDYDPRITYSIVDDDESYESRLRKFDSPTYTINIEWNDPWYNPWWGTWYRPYWSTWGTAWYNPWWGNYYSWWGPSYSPWYGWGGWYDPWWGPSWGPSWYYPWGSPGYYPPHHHSGHGRDVYYGRREGGSSYNTSGHRGANSGGSYTRREPNMSHIRGNNGTYIQGGNTQNRPANTGGSVYRRGGSSSQNGAIYNNSAANAGNHGISVRPNQSGSSNSQGSMYRRSSTTNTRQTATSSTKHENNNTGTTNRSGSSYRNNSSYNRSSGNTSTYNSSSSSRNSSGVSSGSSGGSRSGGSSYRR